MPTICTIKQVLLKSAAFVIFGLEQHFHTKGSYSVYFDDSFVIDNIWNPQQNT